MYCLYVVGDVKVVSKYVNCGLDKIEMIFDVEVERFLLFGLSISVY